ncbi:MAG TPA: DUF167 domain-containing protein [Candidatus Hydrogenedentes bacterium]|nr:DUF167 domain-containing protein [Candidatus Hydrogenedentota bacterium]HPG66931.1 DUF167 domain-containing protein [Candidatus Hydrogenedentota bacterium]
MQAIEDREGSVWLSVRVQPKASRNAIVLEPDGRIRVALTAPPVEGAANKALVAFLSKASGVPKRGIQLIHGERGRDKVLVFKGIDAAHLAAALGIG